MSYSFGNAWPIHFGISLGLVSPSLNKVGNAKGPNKIVSHPLVLCITRALANS